ncbi:MAG TPA: glycosyl hydrolase family 65 protein [Nocardioidaceae bacterium]|nr:glycosyl hydrolase family 65 protein [Nocardioidaceae bacterium]
MTSPAHQAEEPWNVVYDGLDPADEGRREALCVLGNGVFATRGARPEAHADGVHYPGTYRAGVYDRTESVVEGHRVENECLVNLPNWLPFTFATEGQEWFGRDGWQILQQRWSLDLRRGMLRRELRVRDAAGRHCTVTQRRIVHMGLPHVAALETTVRADDWSGDLRFQSGLDGAVENAGVDRYRDLDGHHLRVVDTARVGDYTIVLAAETLHSRIRLAQAARSTVTLNDEPYAASATARTGRNQVNLDLTVRMSAGDRVTVEKVVTMFSSQDRAVDDPARAAVDLLQDLDGFESLREQHELAWEQLWQRFRFDFGKPDAGADTELGTIPQTIRLHLFHVLQTLSPHTAGLDAGVPARGLHGEAYRGHVLWDELFVFPLFTLRLPAVARALLLYRYHRLPLARRAAAEIGLAGAMFPWQSGSDGREESQRLHLNPMSGRWVVDATHRQRHVGLAIAYNVWQYYQATGDRDFLAEYGAEMILEIAKFWASLASYDPGRGRFVIRGVVGPDEFHTGYPGREDEGIDNNAYTNLLTAWVLARALDALHELPEDRRQELSDQLGLRPTELSHWDRIAHALYVPFHDGLISQFEGYDRLTELDWAGYRERYGDLQRMDRILEAEGDSVARYRVSKQADVLMVFYLLSADQIAALFSQLGYDFDPASIPRTVDYYLQRTSHGSTLSAVVHAWVLARGHRGLALEYFDRALASDVADVQGGTTQEGIHLAAMAGTVDLLQRCFAGVEARDRLLRLDPFWPEELGALEFDVRYRRLLLTIRVEGRRVRVRAARDSERPICCGCRGEDTAQIGPGESVEFHLNEEER